MNYLVLPYQALVLAIGFAFPFVNCTCNAGDKSLGIDAVNKTIALAIDPRITEQEFKERMSDISPDARRLVLHMLASRITFSTAIGAPENIRSERHDLSIAGGRYAWALEVMTGSQVPAVTANMTQEALTQVARAAARIAADRVHLDRVDAAKQVASLPVPDRLRLAVRKDHTITDEELTVLSADPVVEVRRAVASNPRTRKDVLAVMLKDPDAEVRWNAEKSMDATWSLFIDGP